MKIDIFNVDEFVQLNHLQEVTSPILFQRGDIPDPDGLISNAIFGVTVKDRKETFAYIDLGGHFFHPHIYKVLKRIFRNIEKVVDGSLYVTIEKGVLTPTDGSTGDTGIEFLYENWNKIDWVKSEDVGMRNERIDLITKSKKDEIFLPKMIVIPAFYRDIKSNTHGGGETVELNTFYTKLIRYSSMLKERNMFDFVFHQMNWNIQNTIVDIYDYFKQKLEKKSGMIRKYLMGKSVDYCTRTVITEPIFHANRPSDMKITFDYSGIPISQAISLLYPFVLRWVKNWFDLNVISMNELALATPSGRIESRSVTLSHPENFYTDKYFRKKFDQYIRDPESRFDPIEVPLADGTRKYLAFTGRQMESDTNREVASIANRRMTWTDLLYMACHDCCKNKHALTTRYPVSDVYGTFISRLEVISTQETMLMQVGDQIYKFYPKIEDGLKPEDVAAKFVDSMQFSLSYLKGLGGDYDGDQVTVKILWTEEANKECEEVMNRKSYLLDTSGKLIRKIEKEALQTFYAMTKPFDPKKHRAVTAAERVALMVMNSEDFTFDFLSKTFGYIVTEGSLHEPKFHSEDLLVLHPGDYPGITKDTETTIGRYIFNMILFHDRSFSESIGYVNDTMTDSNFQKVEAKISKLLLHDKCEVSEIKKYIDSRDWLGLQYHSIITTSFTPGVIKIHKDVKKLREELLKKYKVQLQNGDAKIMSEIEAQLVAKTKEVLKDDPGMNLYNSGARGSVGNNMKNMILVRGAVSDPSTGEFVNVLSSLNDGMRKEDIPSASNIIVSGAYPKAVGTAVSGYASKQILSADQTELVDPDMESDCGTKRGIPTLITEKNHTKYIRRYIMQNGKPVELTEENIRNYIGKTVELRSPMSCLKTKNGCLCHLCVGDFPYMVGNLNIGLSASKIGTTMTNMGMKKFHNNVIKYHKINPEEMLI